MATGHVGTGGLARPGGAKLRSAFSSGMLSGAYEPARWKASSQSHPLRYLRPHLESNVGRRSSVGRA
ncbi:MAG: hypothetical protein WA847_12335, partial [Terriglobales bacterium]